jgi:beta-glucosidase
MWVLPLSVKKPYAEGQGDARSLDLPSDQIAMLERMRQSVRTLIVIIISGRPIIITDQLDLADAWVAAWLPGTEALGITDVIFGDVAFTGKLPYTWPSSYVQLPLNLNNQEESGQQPLFEFGFGICP